jgi:mono/diheme cytochrome c family protein
MKVIAGCLVLGAALAACPPATVADPQPPPGGSAWIRSTVNGAAQPRGYVQYQNFCSSCHAAGPEARPGYEALKARYGDKEPPALSDRTDLTPELVKTMVRTGISIMPFFRKTEISDADLDAIAAYLTRNNRGVQK